MNKYASICVAWNGQKEKREEILYENKYEVQKDYVNYILHTALFTFT